jgi:hypothetical protein
VYGKGVINTIPRIFEKLAHNNFVQNDFYCKIKFEMLQMRGGYEDNGCILYSEKL